MSQKKLNWKSVDWKWILLSSLLMVAGMIVWMVIKEEYSIIILVVSAGIFPLVGILLMIFPPKPAPKVGKYQSPFRWGENHQILDANGKVVAIFKEEDEGMAHEYCKFLNSL